MPGRGAMAEPFRGCCCDLGPPASWVKERKEEKRKKRTKGKKGEGRSMALVILLTAGY